MYFSAKSNDDEVLFLCGVVNIGLNIILSLVCSFTEIILCGPTRAATVESGKKKISLRRLVTKVT